MTDAADDAAFDRSLIAGAFDLAGRDGWRAVSVAAAARLAGLDLGRARARFPGPMAILLRFGLLADQAALEAASAEDVAQGPTTRERLFDMLMRRIDVLQAHRSGVLALFRALPADPGTALLLGSLSRRSMAWMLDAAGVPARGVDGALRAHALLAVWVYTVRAWQSDDSVDLAATMAALDKALGRAEQAANWCARSMTNKPGPTPGTAVALTPTEDPGSDVAPAIPET